MISSRGGKDIWLIYNMHTIYLLKILIMVFRSKAYTSLYTYSSLVWPLLTNICTDYWFTNKLHIWVYLYTYNIKYNKYTLFD